MVRKPCKLDTDFQRSITFQRNIEVWIDGELDSVGKVGYIRTSLLKIEGSYFVRRICEFVMV